MRANTEEEYTPDEYDAMLKSARLLADEVNVHPELPVTTARRVIESDWMKEHDARVRREALKEGWDQGYDDGMRYWRGLGMLRPVNPYGVSSVEGDAKLSGNSVVGEENTDWEYAWEADPERRSLMNPRGPKIQFEGRPYTPEAIAEFPRGRRIRRHRAGPWIVVGEETK